MVGPPKAYEVLGGPINNSRSRLWQHNKSFGEYVDVGQQVVRYDTIQYRDEAFRVSRLLICQVSKSVGVTLENTGRVDCGSLCDTIQSTIR